MSPGIFYTEISIQSGTDQITFHYIGNERLRYNPLEHYCFLLIIAVFRNVPIPCLREYIYLELPQYKHTEQHLLDPICDTTAEIEARMLRVLINVKECQ